MIWLKIREIYRNFKKKFEDNQRDLFWSSFILIGTALLILYLTHITYKTAIQIYISQIYIYLSFIPFFIPYAITNSITIIYDVTSFINSKLDFSRYQGTYWEDPNKVGLPKGPELSDHQFQKIKDERKRIEAYAAARVEYEEQDFKEWKKRNIGVNLDHTRHGIIRVLCVLVFAAFSFGIFTLMGWFDYVQADSLAKLSESDVSRGFFTIPAALIGTIIAAPIVFIIWFFRDHNNRIQIENSRKDTNLKDFQKLCEWASGLHLPENKVTETSKTTTKFVSDGDTKETLTEQINSVEKSEIPTKSDHFTLRTGSEALQNSAIAQLEAFMYGKYGQQFMEPTFKLIYNLYVSFNPNIDDDSGHLSFRTPPNGINFEILRTISNALTGKNGEHIRLFKENLIGSNLSFINCGFNNPIRLNISGLKITNTIFRHANFDLSYCVKCDFSDSNFSNAFLENCIALESCFNGCKFYKTNLNGAKFQYTYLSNCDFSKLDLKNINFAFSYFDHSYFENSNFSNTNFSNCSLTSIQAKNINFIYCNLKDTDFERSSFENVKFINCTVNSHSYFSSKEIENNQMIESILLQSGIWDDDPEWLVGKIQNEALMQRIRKDYSQRQNDLKKQK